MRKLRLILLADFKFLLKAVVKLIRLMCKSIGLYGLFSAHWQIRGKMQHLLEQSHLLRFNCTYNCKVFLFDEALIFLEKKKDIIEDFGCLKDSWATCWPSHNTEDICTTVVHNPGTKSHCCKDLRNSFNFSFTLPQKARILTCNKAERNLEVSILPQDLVKIGLAPYD